MPRITAAFDTRRDTEMAVERLVQEHGLDRSAVSLRAEGEENSAGPELSGADAAAAAEGEEPGGQRAGRILVSAEVAEGEAEERARASFAEFDADEVREG